MSKDYKTILLDCAEDSFVEKKSEFISYVSRADTEQQAKEFIESIKNKHRDATHNVYAYVLKDTGIARCSDDGEPSGTAGMPVLEVIKREGLSGVCVVVTRYFGGILLGAGGLVRAYAKAAKLGLDQAGTAVFTEHITFDVTVSYAEYERITRDLPKYGCACRDTAFSENVRLSLSCENKDFDRARAFLSDATSGKAECVITGCAFLSKI